MNKNRVEAFVDAVFAIIITLLVLEINVGDDPGKDLIHTLFTLYPQFLSYFISFVIVGTYWVQHHMTMHFITKTNRQFLLLNLAFLMTITFIPFLSKVLGEGMDNNQALILYSAVQVLAGTLNTLIWVYAFRKDLTDKGVTKKIQKVVLVRNLISPTLYLIIIPLTLFSMDYAYVVFFLVPLIYVYPSIFDFKWVNNIAHRLSVKKVKAKAKG